MEFHSFKEVNKYAENLIISTAEGDDNIQVWEPKTLAVFGSLKEPSGIPPHCIDYFHNNTDHIAFTLYKTNALYFKQISHPENPPTISRVGHVITCVKTIRKGHIIAVGTNDGVLILWQSFSGKMVRTLDDMHKSALSFIECTSMGDIIATGSQDMMIKIWSFADLCNMSQRPSPMVYYNAHVMEITGITLGRYGSCYSSSHDGTFKVWNIFNFINKCVKEIRMEDKITAFCVDYEEKNVYIGTEKGHINKRGMWDDSCIEKMANKITALCISTDGLFVISGDYQGLIIVWSTALEKLKECRVHKTTISSIGAYIRPVHLYGLNNNSKSYNLYEPKTL